MPEVFISSSAMPSSLATAFSTALSGNGIAGTSGGGTLAVSTVLAGVLVGGPDDCAACGTELHPVRTIRVMSGTITIEVRTPAR
jgi:hypothetical protein